MFDQFIDSTSCFSIDGDNVSSAGHSSEDSSRTDSDISSDVSEGDDENNAPASDWSRQPETSQKLDQSQSSIKIDKLKDGLYVNETYEDLNNSSVVDMDAISHMWY